MQSVAFTRNSQPCSPASEIFQTCCTNTINRERCYLVAPPENKSHSSSND
jgi:hypothetical protein